MLLVTSRELRHFHAQPRPPKRKGGEGETGCFRYLRLRLFFFRLFFFFTKFRACAFPSLFNDNATKSDNAFFFFKLFLSERETIYPNNHNKNKQKKTQNKKKKILMRGQSC